MHCHQTNEGFSLNKKILKSEKKIEPQVISLLFQSSSFQTLLILISGKNFSLLWSSRPEVFFVKGVLKICGKFTGEHPCRSVISIKLLCNFIKITLRHGRSTVNLLHIFRTTFPKNTSEWLLLSTKKVSYFIKVFGLWGLYILRIIVEGLQIRILSKPHCWRQLALMVLCINSMKPIVLAFNGFHRVRSFSFALSDTMYWKKPLYFLDEVSVTVSSMFSHRLITTCLFGRHFEVIPVD